MTTRLLAAVAFAVLSTTGRAIELEAQPLQGTSIGLGGGTTELVLLDEGQHRNVLLQGITYGVEGRLAVRWMELEGRFLQASVGRADIAGSVGDLLEGDALIGLRFVPWLRIEGGPLVRGFVTPAGTRRLVRWSAGASARVPIVRELLWGRASYWRTLSGRSNARGSVARGRSMEWALTVEPPGWYGWGSVSYRLERDNFVGGTRWSSAESAERIVLTVGLRIP